eukprot:GHVN01034899.1.p1 GENE.GHVN01034899.1~~GHVN01034899.1.p1  ORF type:complete len:127 (+),score=8.75 GHVN01034899.1:89-469(+)
MIIMKNYEFQGKRKTICRFLFQRQRTQRVSSLKKVTDKTRLTATGGLDNPSKKSPPPPPLIKIILATQHDMDLLQYHSRRLHDHPHFKDCFLFPDRRLPNKRVTGIYCEHLTFCDIETYTQTRCTI